MINLLWTLIYKVFAFVVLGAALKRFTGERGEGTAKVFIWITLYLLIPAYIFLTMWYNPLSFAYSWKTAVCAFAVVLFGAFFMWVWAWKEKISFKEHCLPVIFMNSAYLAIPVNTLLWGAQGAAYAIIYNMVITVATFTLGIWWVSKKSALSEIAGLPVLYAAAAGAALNAIGTGFPHVLGTASKMISFVTLPVMLIFVGYRLGEIKAEGFKLVIWGVSLRMLGGCLAGAGVAYILGITGPAGRCMRHDIFNARRGILLHTDRKI